MEQELDDSGGPIGSFLVKDFSFLSLTNTSANIEGTPWKSAGTDVVGTGLKVGAYNVAQRSGTAIGATIADGLHFFGESVSLPLSLAATAQNMRIADKCTCEAKNNPNYRQQLRQYQQEKSYYDNTYRPSTSLGF